MQGMSNQDQLQFHRLLNRAIAHAINCQAVPTGFCGQIIIHADAQYGLTVKTSFQTALSNEHKARQGAESGSNKTESVL